MAGDFLKKGLGFAYEIALPPSLYILKDLDLLYDATFNTSKLVNIKSNEKPWLLQLGCPGQAGIPNMKLKIQPPPEKKHKILHVLTHILIKIMSRSLDSRSTTLKPCLSLHTT